MEHVNRCRLARVVIATALFAATAAALTACGRATRLAAPAREPGASEWAFGPGASGDAREDRGPRSRPRDHQPLAVGNRWDYLVALTTRIVIPGTPDGIALSEHPWVAEVTGTEVFGGRLYHMQAEYNPLELGQPLPLRYLFALRQDRSGLYNRDLVYATDAGRAGESRADDTSGEAAALRASVASTLAGHPQQAAFERAADALAARIARLRAAALAGRLKPGGGPGPEEISLLRYPMRAGARWVVRDSPRFTRVVEGRQSLELAAGRFVTWRIRGDSEFFGPSDIVRFWYASEGLVRMLLHTESDATDQQGNVVGRLVWESDQRLVGFSLAGPAETVARAAGEGPGPGE
jgi:hypothetical protein